MMLGAYPSVGKTAFALNVALKQDYPVVIFSLEMSSEMIYERLVSSKYKIDYNVFSTQDFTERQKKEIAEGGDYLKNKPLYVFDDIYNIEGQKKPVRYSKNRLRALWAMPLLMKLREGRTAESTERDNSKCMKKK